MRSACFERAPFVQICIVMALNACQPMRWIKPAMTLLAKCFRILEL